MEKILILTGGSKGLGFGIAKAFLDRGYKVISIARTLHSTFIHEKFIQVQLDIIQDNFLQQFKFVLEKEISSVPEELILINNAGTLGEVDRIENIPIDDIARTFQINTVIPIQLSSLFIHSVKNLKIQKTILTISSGAAQNSVFGWSVYCSSKAAIDHFTRTVGLEQEEIENGVKTISIYPGVVDTDMQTQIRSLKVDAFQSLEKFIAYKENNQLVHPDVVGEEIFQIYSNPNIVSGSILKVNDYRQKQ